MKKKDIFYSKKNHINHLNQLYIDEIYTDFLKNPQGVSIYWRNFFQKNKKYFVQKKKLIHLRHSHKKLKNCDFTIYKIIQLFRTHGHKYATLNPLQVHHSNSSIYPFLSFKYIINTINNTKKKNNTKIPNKYKKIKKIYKKFTDIYCKSIGIEYMYIDCIKERKWIQKYVENQFTDFVLSKKKKIHLLNSLVHVEIFEKYLNTTFPGSKRFSLEGCEILITTLQNIIYYASKKLLSKIIIGMSHRGRLNVLTNVLNKKISTLCNEFSDKYVILHKSGDAKYHIGRKKHIQIKKNIITIDLKYNPSHLEIINPVVMGSAKACIEKYQHNTNKILPINIHGDAAIIGQGVNQELINMSQTNHYHVGGTIHIIINNQIGFTTSNKKDSRSSNYCSDIAKITQSPVFHVNVDHPESVIFIIKMAFNYRHIFKKDIFINLVGYRRRGHNESDDPSVTQPIMYKKIKKHPTICEIYYQYLKKKNIISVKPLYHIHEKFKQEINILKKNPHYTCHIKKKNHIHKKKKNKTINLKKIAIQINSIPKNIYIHNRVLKIYTERYHAIMCNKLIDWGHAENLAYAYILSQGISCRLSGEDVSRGTFFHRHSVIFDQNNGMKYIPLNNIKGIKKKFYVCDSVLSEEAVLAFEYGYSIDASNSINIWEAQFGDFMNGAQIVIDQFISSGEQKWGIKSKLIMLLPHGYEGQGPEHSSARIERFLQLCAQNNMKICVPSTSSQIYHLLCNQAMEKIYTPLIIFTPKSLLRNPQSHVYFQQIQKNNFQTVIHNLHSIKIHNIKNIIFCSGKIYYELFNFKTKYKKNNTLLIRIEQLYPFPKKDILNLLYQYIQVQNIIWCQEEPKNQGAWHYISNKLKNNIPPNITFNYVGRPKSSSPAVGSFYMHQKQQKKIINTAFNIN
ncbi:2-oxoglutarate dehydrogenase E1 component [Buchnera aphidicola (Pterocallis alni)]|uniref:2-oxoglutarate dehydrogenase E1 component n=1 Tax=Buchnera aphidicola TaxID=9 RepID=UPI003464C221